jgi:hypothetical protein
MHDVPFNRIFWVLWLCLLDKRSGNISRDSRKNLRWHLIIQESRQGGWRSCAHVTAIWSGPRLIGLDPEHCRKYSRAQYGNSKFARQYEEPDCLAPAVRIWITSPVGNVDPGRALRLWEYYFAAAVYLLAVFFWSFGLLTRKEAHGCAFRS